MNDIYRVKIGVAQKDFPHIGHFSTGICSTWSSEITVINPPESIYATSLPVFMSGSLPSQ